MIITSQDEQTSRSYEHRLTQRLKCEDKQTEGAVIVEREEVTINLCQSWSGRTREGDDRGDGFDDSWGGRCMTVGVDTTGFSSGPAGGATGRAAA